jgi:hypothetical protein
MLSITSLNVECFTVEHTTIPHNHCQEKKWWFVNIAYCKNYIAVF